jgi:hypothetical protein
MQVTWSVVITGNTINNVQTVNIDLGRQNLQDPFRAGTATITGRNIDALPTILIGNSVTLTADGDGTGDYIMFRGRVSDVAFQYGMVANEDTWTITAEDALGGAGRQVTTEGWPSNYTTYQAAEEFVNETEIEIDSVSPSLAGSSIVSPQSIENGNVLEVLQQLIQTEQGRIFGLSFDSIRWVGRDELGYVASYEFTDGSVTPTLPTTSYDVLNFRAFADNVANRVVVEPDGLASQSSGSGSKTFTLKSYDVSTSQAGNLASYVRSTLDQTADVPFSVSTRSSMQSNNDLLGMTAQGFYNLLRLPIVLRGVTYQCLIEGVQISSTPSDTRFTFTLSAAASQAFFILDDNFYGRLQDNGPPAFNNKLGF